MRQKGIDMKKIFVALILILIFSCVLASCKPYTGEDVTQSQTAAESSTALQTTIPTETDVPDESESDEKENVTSHDENEGEWDVE